MNTDRYIERLFGIVTDAVVDAQQGEQLDAADIKHSISKQLAALQAEAADEGFAAGYRAGRDEAEGV